MSFCIDISWLYWDFSPWDMLKLVTPDFGASIAFVRILDACCHVLTTDIDAYAVYTALGRFNQHMSSAPLPRLTHKTKLPEYQNLLFTLPYISKHSYLPTIDDNPQPLQ